MKHSIERNFSIESDGFKAIDRHWNTLWCFNIDTVMDLKYSTDIETFCDKGSDKGRGLKQYINIETYFDLIHKWLIITSISDGSKQCTNIEYYFIKRKWWVLSKMN